MSLELLQLSARVLGLVLLCSALTFTIGWWWRSLQQAPEKEAAPTIQPVSLPADTERISLLQAQLAQAELHSASALEQRDTAESETRKQSSALLSLEAEAATLRCEKQSLASLVSSHSEAAETLRSGQQELSARVLTAESATARAKAELLELESKVAKAQASAAEHQSRSSAAEQKQRSFAKELEGAKAAQARANSQNSELQASLEAARSEIATLRAELATAVAAAQAAATHSEEATPPKRKPPTRKTKALAPGESPVAVAQQTAAQAQATLAELTTEYEQRLSTVNELDSRSPLPKTELAAARSLLRDTQKRLAEARTSVERSTRQLAALERTFAALPDGEPDDLTLIKGVKTVLSAKLNAYGIFTYQQILQWPEADRLAYGELLGFGNRIERDDWVGQVQQLLAERAD